MIMTTNQERWQRMQLGSTKSWWCIHGLDWPYSLYRAAQGVVSLGS